MKAFRWLAEIISVMLLGLFLSWLLMPVPKSCPCPSPCPCPPPKVGPTPAPQPDVERHRKRKKPRVEEAPAFMPLLQGEDA